MTNGQLNSPSDCLGLEKCARYCGKQGSKCDRYFSNKKTVEAAAAAVILCPVILLAPSYRPQWSYHLHAMPPITDWNIWLRRNPPFPEKISAKFTERNGQNKIDAEVRSKKGSIYLGLSY